MLKAEVRSRAPPCRQLFSSPLRVVANTDTHVEYTVRAIQVERLRGTLGTPAADDLAVAAPASPSRSARAIRTGCSGGGLSGHDRTRILELAGRALRELTTMCSAGEPLWVRSVETGRDVLNYDEYARRFQRGDDPAGDQRTGWSVEASRETGVAYLDTTQLVHAFMDVV